MRDGPLRSLVKLLALARQASDLAVSRMIRRFRMRPRYVLRGSCLACGRCCDTPMIQIHPIVFRLPTLRRAVLAWHRVVNRLEFLGWDRQCSAMVFRCLHLDPTTRRCDAYATRPGFCRDYPRPLLDASDPVFIPGCGYWAMSRLAARLSTALAAAELDTATRDKLERGLHVRQ